MTLAVRYSEKAWQTWYRLYEAHCEYHRGYEQAVRDIMSYLKGST